MKNKKNTNKIFKISFILLIPIFIYMFYIFNNTDDLVSNYAMNGNLSSLMKHSKSEKKTGQKIQISILNGCGQKGAADLYTNFFRSKGFDVIDFGNADNFNYLKTTLIVHNDIQIEHIKELINLISIKPEQMEYKTNDENIFYTATLVIGKDYNQLKSFSEVSMYYDPF